MYSKLLLVLGMIFSGTALLAQPNSISEIEFIYDAAGNRIVREIIYYESYQKSAITTEENEEDMDLPEGLKVYPNPASECIFVTLNQEALDEAHRMITLYDNIGKLVHRTQATNEINRIDVSSFPYGTYILKLEFGSKHKEWIIIKN